MRPTRFDLLLQPTMAGLETEAQSSRGLANSILGGIQDVSHGIVRSRQEAESKRRFEITEARQREAQIDLRREIAQQKTDLEREKLQGAQADFESRLQALRDATAGGDVEAFKTLVPTFGGPEAAQKALELDPTDWAGPWRGEWDTLMKGPWKGTQAFFDRHPEVEPGQPYVAPSTGSVGPAVSNPSGRASIPSDTWTTTAAPAAAPATPTVGPLGVPDRPSAETLAEAAALKERHDLIVQAQRALRMKSKSPLLSADDRAAADLEWKQADDKRIALAARIKNLIVQGTEAQRRETMRDREAAAREGAYQKRTDEMEQFRSLAPTRFPDLTQSEMEDAAGALASGMTAESTFALLKTKRDETTAATKAAEVKSRVEERLQMSRERFAMAKERHAAFVKRAEDAIKTRDATAFEKVVNDAEEDVTEARRDLDLALNEKSGSTPEEIHAAKQTYESAKHARDKVRMQRPGNPAGKADTTRTDAAEEIAKEWAGGIQRNLMGGLFGGGVVSGAPGPNGASKATTGVQEAPAADFNTIDAQVRKEMAGKPEKEIKAEVVKRLRAARGE